MRQLTQALRLLHTPCTLPGPRPQIGLLPSLGRTRMLATATLLSSLVLVADAQSGAGPANAGSLNGVRDATRFAGADIGAKVNAAFADCAAKPCTVFVPAGDYHFTSTILIPGGTSFTLLLDSGAFLQYDGSERAIQTSRRSSRTFLRGGHIYGNPSAKAGLVLFPETQGIYVDEMDFKGFSGGDGILNLGANVVKITNTQVRDNLFGIHLIGSAGYASNNVTVSGCAIVGNTRWGIVDGDITQFYQPNWMGTGLGPGNTTAELNNVFVNNDLETNGRDPSGRYGAVLEALTIKSVYSGNYFEASPHNIQLGCLNFADPVYQKLYGVKGPNCGTTVAATVRDNYFTNGAAVNVELFAAIGTVIEGNAELGDGTDCFASITGSALSTYAEANLLGGGPKANHGRGEWQYCRGSGAGLVQGWSK